jgi:hypothetical protein
MPTETTTDAATASVLLDTLEPHWAAMLLCVEWGWDRAFWILSRSHHEAANEAMFAALEWLVVEGKGSASIDDEAVS